jgi:hypothetical protein
MRKAFEWKRSRISMLEVEAVLLGAYKLPNKLHILSFSATCLLFPRSEPSSLSVNGRSPLESGHGRSVTQ